MQFLYQKFIQSLPIEDNQSSDWNVYLFNKEELLKLKKIYRQTLIFTAITGGCCIVSYYIPTYIFASLFQTRIPITLFGFTFELGTYELLWCLIMTIIEIVLLTLIHLRMTHRISVISGLLNSKNKHEVLKDILKMGTGTKDKSIVNYGLNPIKDVSRLYLMAINALYIFKAFLSNQLLRLILRQFIARYLFKYFLDLIGTPIYMFFNALNSHFVYGNIISTIMGRQIISIYTKDLHLLELNDSEKELVYDALHLVVVSKKDFNYNHAALAKAILETLKIKAVKEHDFKEDDLLNLKNYNPAVQKLVLDIVILGFVLDGKISNREKRQIEKLNEKYDFELSVDRLKDNAKDFMKGKGVELVNVK
jgi:hypothetical protein